MAIGKLAGVVIASATLICSGAAMAKGPSSGTSRGLGSTTAPTTGQAKGLQSPTPPGWTQGDRKGWNGGTTPPGWTSQGTRSGWDGQASPPGIQKR